MITESGQPERGSEAMEHLLARTHQQLIAIADGIVRDRHEAEDVVQETVTAVWLRSSAIDPEKLGNYLTRAVRLNALKRKARRRDVVFLDGDDVAGPVTGRDPRFVDPLDLEEAIEALPLVQQNVIRMKYYFGMSFRQIGAAMSVSTDTAASRCRYALAKLRNILNRQGDGT